MEWWLDINFWIIVFCSTIGSVKASIEFDADKKCFPRGVDIVVGIICGMALVHHYANHLSISLSALVAVVGGAGGALALEAFLSLLPAVTRKVIQKWINKFIE